MEIRKKLKIYPSASGFMLGSGVIAEYNSACPRYIVISKEAKQKDIDPIYKQLGVFHEDWYASQLGTDLEERERPITFEIENNVWYSGRCDFQTKSGEIHETKASLSKNFLYSVINKGKYKTSHLAQLVSYMIQFKRTKGKIICGFYKKKDETFEQIKTRIFEVGINPEGRILVDNLDSGYSVQDQLGHLKLVAEILISEEIKDRPINHIDFSGPCFFCGLKNLCKSYDNGSIGTAELKVEGKKVLNNT